MRGVVSTIEFDMTEKRILVVGPVFLGSSSRQSAMTLDLDGQAVAPGRPRCRHTRKLALLAPEAASSARRRFDWDVPGKAGSDRRPLRARARPQGDLRLHPASILRL
jgi:hypothetical protein